MRKITLLMVMFIFAITVSYGQSASSYTFSSSSGTYTENSTSATVAAVHADDVISVALPIGFTFVYEGVSYTEFKMSSNGFICFNTAATNAMNVNNFSDANPAFRPIIAPLWDDLDGTDSTGASATYEVTGTGANRVLTVEWRNWEWNYSSGTTPVISFQVKLYETTNVIEFVYRQEAGTVNEDSEGASIGIGSATGSGSGSFLNVTSVDVPAVSSTISVNDIFIKPISGQTFTFTPPTPCVGTPVAGLVLPVSQNICSGTVPARLIASGYSTNTGITFQWEESDDNGSTDAWTNAVGGTGATTATYTPPAFSGTPVYYRLKLTCVASSEFSETASVLISTPVAPSVQTTDVLVPSELIAGTQARVNWVNGNGGRRVVYINNSSTFTDPVNGFGPALIANNVYSGSGQQIVYDGTAATTIVRGLTNNTQYYVKVYEYVRCGSAEPYDYYYNVITGTNTANFTTCSASASLPWIENFESITTIGNLRVPSCWVVENGDWATSTFTTYNTPNSPTTYLTCAYSAANEYIWTQGFNLTAGSSYDFSSYIQGDGWTGWAVDYFVNTTQNSADATQLGTTYNVPGTDAIAIQSHNKMTRTFVPATSGVYYFGVRVNQPSGTPWYVGFDDFELKISPTVAPVCATSLMATPDPSCGNSVNVLAWAADPVASGYRLTIGTTSGGNEIVDNIDVSGTTYTFSGTVNTQYFWTVIPYNGVGSATDCTEQTFTTAATGCYCPSEPTSIDGDGITNVQIAGTNFPTTNVPYFDHSGTTVDMFQGINNSVQITFNTEFSYYTNIWIDSNDNYIFEASELVFSGESTDDAPAILNASFVVPATTPTGQHRMRIGTADEGQEIPNPCYSEDFGVTLDFSINVVAASCTPPVATATVLPDCTANTYSIEVDVTNLGDATTPYISDGVNLYAVTAIGVVTIGPIPTGTATTVTLHHGTDAVCDVVLGTYNYTACPPVNDACTDAIVVTALPYTFSQDASGSTNNDGNISPCWGMNDGVWYTFTVGTPGDININISGVTGWDPKVAVYTGSCGVFVCEDSSDGGGTGDDEILELSNLEAGQYWINIGHYDSADDFPEGPLTIDITGTVTLGNESFDTRTFRAYPNPVKDVLNLSYSLDISNVEVFNMLGQSVMVKKVNATQGQVDMSNLTSGSYIVKVTSNGLTQAIKVIKQ